MSLPFSEWSREAKDEFAEKRMEEMKLKNEALKQRYAEVEQDRIKAEAKHSAVKILKKENAVIEKEEDNPKVEREWDKGKVDQDAEDWNPPKFFGYRSRTQRRNFPDRNSPKKENWRVRSANVGKDRQSYSKFKSSGPNHKYQETSNYGSSGYRNENANFSRQRGRTHRTSSGGYRSFQNSRYDEPRKKQISGGAASASPSLSDSELEPAKVVVCTDEVDRMWHSVGISEAKHKQSRVEKWVKAINTTSSWSEEYDNVKGNDYYEKRGEGGHRDTVKSYGYGNEERYPKKNQSSRDQTHLKNRERYDGLKYGQSSRGNSRARGSRTPTGERTTGGFEDKNQRDFRKRNYSDKNKFRRESDYSDRTSSMKESDYHSCNKDKFNKTASDSKSSDYSGVWEDAVCDVKYDSEKKSFDRQSNTRNYGKDKFNKSKNVQFPTVSSSQDVRKKDDFGEEYARNTRQKLPNSYVKDKSKTKNLRNTDHSGFDDQHIDNKASARKVKSNKYKTESKFIGHSGKFENESAVDNQASRKYKMNDPTSKRMLSSPNKSVDTSSSASKTLEFNPDTDGMWGDCEQDTVWSIDRNDNQTEHNSSLVGEEAAGNEVSQSLDWSTPVKTDCDQARASPEYEMNKPSPKSSPVKSVDTSSSASKTLEFNPNADMCGNYEQDTVWSKDRDDNQTEHKSSFVEEGADVNEVSQPLDWSTPVEKDCDQAGTNYEYEISNSSSKSSPVKSIDTSSPTSKITNVDDIGGDIVQNTARNMERNDNQAEHKSSLVEEEADVKEVSQSLDWSTPVKTDCDTGSEKLFNQNSELKSYEVNGVAVSEHHDSNVGDCDVAGSTCPDETIVIEKDNAAVGYNVMTNGSIDDSSKNVKYSGDQDEDNIEIEHLVSGIVNIVVDSCEGKSSSKVSTNESKSSLPEVPEMQNSQDKIVQSTEIELTKLSDNVNLDRSDLEVAEEKISVGEASSNDTDCKTPTEQEVENDKVETVGSEIKDMSSQSINAACTKFDSENVLESSGIVTVKPQFPKCQGNDTGISSGALNLSDDGGWSTISEDENNASDDDKNDKIGSPAEKSDT